MHEVAKLLSKALASEFLDLRNPAQVISGGRNRYVSHVKRELWKLRLNIIALAIPTKQCMNGESVPKVVRSVFAMEPLVKIAK